MVDLDSQGHSTKWLLPSVPKGVRGTLGVIETGETPAASEMLPVPGREGLWVLPGSRALAMAELLLAHEPDSGQVLARALEGLRGRFDVVVLDCPPALGHVTSNAIAAATGVVVPVLSAALAVDGLVEFDVTLEKVRRRTNPRARVLGYLHNAVNASHRVTGETRELLREQRGPLLFSTELRASVRQADIQLHHATAWDKGEDPRGREDWERLLPEVLERLEGRAA